MSKSSLLLVGTCAAVLFATLTAHADPQEQKKPEPDPAKLDADAGDGVARYCANIAPVVVEARIAWQMKRLAELDAQIKKRIAELDAKEAEARDWVNKREDMLKKAEDDIVAIYAKMQPEAAAAQLIAMDDASAAAILSKLNPRAASAILDEMEAARAAKLTDLISGAAKDANPTAAPSPSPSSDDGKKS
jgi:flagellar motility protein MotE (MotC chaperone)